MIAKIGKPSRRAAPVSLLRLVVPFMIDKADELSQLKYTAQESKSIVLTEFLINLT
jgi:hypothetical protein